MTVRSRRPPTGVPESLPRKLRPMLARPGELPSSSGWAFEFKWDGVRALISVQRGRVEVHARRGNVVTASYPELQALADVVQGDVLLDGEIVYLAAGHQPDFAGLQRRLQVTDSGAAARLAAELPVTFLAFDLLHVDGHSTRELSYLDRRTLLSQLVGESERCAVPAHFGDGAAVLQVAQARDLEGVLAKREDSRYLAGRRSAAWLKVKLKRHQEVVIVGWRTGTGRRAGGIGALLLAVPDGDQLRYVGRVGTGFTDDALALLAAQLQPLTTTESPLDTPLPAGEARAVTWVQPALVAEVSYAEWTTQGRLRHPSWRGLRPDKLAAEVHGES